MKLLTLITLLSFAGSLTAMDLKPCLGDGGMFGFCDTEGSVVIPHEYDEAFEFIAGHAPVKKGEKWGIIDENGKWMVKPTYDEVFNCDKVTDMILVRVGKKWCFVNAYGVQMTHEYEVSIAWLEFSITNSTAHMNPDGWFAVIKNGKWGMIDIHDNIEVPFDYDWIRSLTHEGGNRTLILKKDDKFALAKSGELETAEFAFDEFMGMQGQFAFFKKDNVPVIMDIETGAETDSARKNRYALVNAEEKMGFVNEQGQIVIPFEHDIINPYTIPGMVIFGSEEKLGIADINGNIAMEAKYKDIKHLDVYPGLLAVRNQSNKVAMFQVEGDQIKAVTDFEFNFVTLKKEEILVNANGKMGYATPKGEVTWR